MSNNSSGSNSNGSRMEVPQAKGAMDKFKMEVASELGINLKPGYNGDLTSAQNGSIGGEMVRRMIKRQEEQMANGTSNMSGSNSSGSNQSGSNNSGSNNSGMN